MSLRCQVASLLIALSIVFAATTYAVQALVVMPAFVQLERQNAERDVDRCVAAIERDVENLSLTANDWASWDDTYKYVNDRNEAFVRENLVAEAFTNTHLNFICILDASRKVVWSEVRDGQTQEVLDMPELIAALQDESSPVTWHADVDDACKGILLTSRGPLLLASRPILTTRREGPVRGSFVMGRLLDDRETARLGERVHVPLAILPLRLRNLPAEAQRALAASSTPGAKQIESGDARILHAYTVVNDVYGQPGILLRISVPRDVTLQGRIAANAAAACSIGGGVCTLLAMGVVLQRRILGPLQQLSEHAMRFGELDGLDGQVAYRRGDEIGTLAGAFDRMVARLEESPRRGAATVHEASVADLPLDVPRQR